MRYLKGQAIGKAPKTIRFEDLNLSYFQYKERVDKPKTPTDTRAGFEEIFGNLSRKQALGEAHRCFSCGMCYHCGNCLVFCPDGSVLDKETDAFNVINYEYCKGCGICENECPVGVIEMERED
jgi:2-oxoacid:acceptor oxidoreductase delta subunit (pyruvate/2-ketoisovalerate family)